MVRKTRKQIEAEELKHCQEMRKKQDDIVWIIQHYKPEE